MTEEAVARPIPGDLAPDGRPDMMTPLIALSTALLLPSAHAFETRKSSVIDKVTARDVSAMLQMKGHEIEQKVDDMGDPLLNVKAPDLNYQVIFYNCTSNVCDTCLLYTSPSPRD